MVRVKFDNQSLILSVKGLHKVWALKSQIKIPLSHIQDVRINNDEIHRPKGWRLPGTYIPGIIIAGIYRSYGRQVFWDVVNKEKTIIIDLQDDCYKQIIIEVEDPEKTIEQISQRRINLTSCSI